MKNLSEFFHIFHDLRVKSSPQTKRIIVSTKVRNVFGSDISRQAKKIKSRLFVLDKPRELAIKSQWKHFKVNDANKFITPFWPNKHSSLQLVFIEKVISYIQTLHSFYHAYHNY